MARTRVLISRCLELSGALLAMLSLGLGAHGFTQGIEALIYLGAALMACAMLLYFHRTTGHVAKGARDLLRHLLAHSSSEQKQS